MSKAARRYTSAHWGIAPARRRALAIPGLGRDEEVTEMGRLVELRVQASPSEPHYTIDFAPPGGTPPCLLVFTPDKRERVFFYLPAAYRRVLAAELFDVELPTMPLAALAKEVGGTQCRHPFPVTPVQALGACAQVIYSTHKKGDGPSSYYHDFGEESGLKPWLAIDKTGQLWLAGGNYSVPDAGITD